MENNNFNKIICDILESNISGGNICIQSGNNGPYGNDDTLARNYSHWIGIVKYYYKISKKSECLHIMKKLADNLCDNCTSYGNIKCFNDNELIETNGLIGQAWVIEGLINAYSILKDQKYYNQAVKIFLSQHFDYKNHLWRVVNCSGKELNFDYVFNHQLWFAASGYMILNEMNNSIIRKELDDFSSNIFSLFECYPNGLLKHLAVVGFDIKYIKSESQKRRGKI